MRIIVASLSLLAVSVTALTDQEEIAAALEKLGEAPSKFVLYSLDPLKFPSQSVPAATLFHHFDILGHTEITDRSEQRALLRALAGGVREKKNKIVAACFNPVTRCTSSKAIARLTSSFALSAYRFRHTDSLKKSF